MWQNIKGRFTTHFIEWNSQIINVQWNSSMLETHGTVHFFQHSGVFQLSGITLRTIGSKKFKIQIKKRNKCNKTQIYSLYAELKFMLRFNKLKICKVLKIKKGLSSLRTIFPYKMSSMGKFRHWRVSPYYVSFIVTILIVFVECNKYAKFIEIIEKLTIMKRNIFQIDFYCFYTVNVL